MEFEKFNENDSNVKTSKESKIIFLIPRIKLFRRRKRTIYNSK